MKLLVKNALIADGTGAPLFRGELAAENGVIRDLAGFVPDRVIDAAGRILAPGFIDVHGHSDLSLAASPKGFGKRSQGFTAEISGNCGLSPFPLTGKNRDHLQQLYRRYGISLDWENCGEYLAFLASRNPALTLFPLAGHNTLRAAVAGYEGRSLEKCELSLMLDLLNQSFAEGAVGLSSGLLYTPGCFADRAELAALIGEVARAGKIYAIHLRSEGNELLESLSETLDLAREAGLKRLQISHFKTAGKANWHKLDAAIKLLENARRDGIAIGVDRYPYIESMTQLSVIAPSPWNQIDDVTLMDRLRDEGEFERFTAALERDWSTVRLAGTDVPEFARFRGWKFPAIAAELGESPARLAARMLRLDSVGSTGAFAGMCEENLERILALDYCMCGSDESARPEDFSLGSSHPRGFGSSAEFFRRLAPEFGVAEAVRRMTSLPARHFGLAGRGELKAGYRADLVLIDPENFKARADFNSPHRACFGITVV